MNIKETNDYVLSHGILNRNRQVVLTKPMKVFKKVYGNNCNRAIANLIIPADATVNLAQTKHLKLRASKACCVSIFIVHTKREIFKANSDWDWSFEYRTGSVYTPEFPFKRTLAECESGIHFFAELDLALNY